MLARCCLSPNTLEHKNDVLHTPRFVVRGDVDVRTLCERVVLSPAARLRELALLVEGLDVDLKMRHVEVTGPDGLRLLRDELGAAEPQWHGTGFPQRWWRTARDGFVFEFCEHKRDRDWQPKVEQKE
jgi:hypothetical protein